MKFVRSAAADGNKVNVKKLLNKTTTECLVTGKSLRGVELLCWRQLAMATAMSLPCCWPREPVWTKL